MYECIRCGYKGKYKHHLVNHLKRKKPCSALILDIPRNELLQELKKKPSRKTKRNDSPNKSTLQSDQKSIVTHKCSFCENT